MSTSELGPGGILYNGIRLPDLPNRDPEAIREGEAMPVPYLDSPPDVIPIDVGRQLFVDDFLVADTTLRRTFHKAEYWEGNPVLKPEKRWEFSSRRPTAMAFSDGIFYDLEEKLFRMWYRAGSTTCIATSQDGMDWERPELGLMPGTNIVCLSGSRDSSTIWPDPKCDDPEARYKMFVFHRDPWKASIYLSPDGYDWRFKGWTGTAGDRSTMFYNPFRKVWVYSIRDHIRRVPGPSKYPDNPLCRARRYRECTDFVEGSTWEEGEAGWWVGADRLDARHPEAPEIRPELYNLDAVAYESLMLGLFSVWQYQPTDRPKINEVQFGFSRDGLHWDRPCREPIMAVSEGRADWNWGNLQSAGGCCLVVEDRLFFYVSGRNYGEGEERKETMSMGLAFMRRDGFASMDAGAAGGTLTTRPVRFSGSHLYVNADAGDGELRVEALDEGGATISPFVVDNCIPIRADETRKVVSWKGVEDLSPLAGRPVRFRFHLTHGRLFAFWVSPERSGASNGFVAAGGPGFGGSRDA